MFFTSSPFTFGLSLNSFANCRFNMIDCSYSHEFTGKSRASLRDSSDFPQQTRGNNLHIRNLQSFSIISVPPLGSVSYFFARTYSSLLKKHINLNGSTHKKQSIRIPLKLVSPSLRNCGDVLASGRKEDSP